MIIPTTRIEGTGGGGRGNFTFVFVVFCCFGLFLSLSSLLFCRDWHRT